MIPEIEVDRPYVRCNISIPRIKSSKVGQWDASFRAFDIDENPTPLAETDLSRQSGKPSGLDNGPLRSPLPPPPPPPPTHRETQRRNGRRARPRKRDYLERDSKGREGQRGGGGEKRAVSGESPGLIYLVRSLCPPPSVRAAPGGARERAR